MAQTQEWTRQQRLLDYVIRNRRPVAYALFGVSAALTVLWIWLAFRLDDEADWGFGIDWNYWPGAIAAFLVALVALGSGLWLLLAPDADVTEFGVRCLALAAGGLTGLVLFLMAIGLAALWWDVVFSGGLEAWRGPEWWKLWVCALVALVGLAVMFASLLLARAEERSSAVLRRLLYGYNTVLGGLLLLAILLLGNVMVYAVYPSTYQWTKTRGLYDLSSRTKNLLTHLRRPVQVYVVMAQGGRVYREVRTLLDNMEAVTNKLKVTTISPDIEPQKVEDLKKRFQGQNISRGILLAYGSPGADGNSLASFIPEDRLFDREFGRAGGEASQTLVFKGEDALMTELRFLTEGRQKAKVYFTQGNGELRLADNSPSGLSLLAGRLRLDNFDVAALRLQQPPPGARPNPQLVESAEVPRDASAVVIVRPTVPFAPKAREALQRYLERRGGRLLVLFGLSALGRQMEAPDAGLNRLLERFNAEVGGGYVLRYTTDSDPREVRAYPPEDSSNGIARALGGKPLILFAARPVRGLSRSGKYRLDVLLQVPADEGAWVETDLRTVFNPAAYLAGLGAAGLREKYSREPIPLAVAVTDTAEDKPRLVAVGDVSMATNVGLRNEFGYYDLLYNSLQWLLGRGESLGIAPQKSNRFSLDVAALTESRLARMRYLPAWIVAVSILALGAGIWVVRRR